MIDVIDDALRNTILNGITLPPSQFIQSQNLDIVWFNGDRHAVLRKGGIGPYGSIQELSDLHDPDREPPRNARLWKHKTGSSKTRAIVAPFPEPRIFTYQINLWAEERRGMTLARQEFLRAVPKRFFQTMTVDPYGDGETCEIKTFVTRDDGNVIDSLDHPRHSEWAYTMKVKGWLFKGQSTELATFQKLVTSFAVVPLHVDIQQGTNEIEFVFDKTY